MEDGVGVVAIEAVLEEVTGSEWGLFGEELEEEVAGGGVEDAFGGGLGFEVVESGHGGERRKEREGAKGSVGSGCPSVAIEKRRM